MLSFRCILVFLLISKSYSLFSQNDSIFRQTEDSVVYLLNQIKTASSDSEKLDYNQQLVKKLQTTFTFPQSFNYPFDSLKHFGKIITEDNLCKIITWNTILLDGTNIYSGFILKRNKVDSKVKVFKLTDRASEVNLRESSVLSAGKWFGGLYYKSITRKIDQTYYYTLLAVRYNDLFTNDKIIEVLYFDEFGNPVFGAPLFEENKKLKLRRVFEYSANVAMNLNYRDDLKMIVFDHLSPSDDRFKDQFEQYGPDLSFDGYQFKSNRWKFVSNINLKSNEESKKKYKKSSTPASNRIIGN